MKGFSTKYALSNGIQEVEVELVPSGEYVDNADGYLTYLVLGKTFFEHQNDAEHNARQQATKKIASLEKQITKLRKDWS
jgi:hypothetical protein